ncbi:MAG TPA: endonuclease/exonuclease/phosphatase family protein [Blastocatellia bacterium]|nr:endonuclease/exonuclease/phosphatase family protein [Blastocatellia bacterium]
MSIRFSRIALAALLVIIAHQSASAQFTLLSQNTLHLGWGQPAYQTNKNTYMFNNVIGVPANFDVVILQEVMDQANLAAITIGFLPGTYAVVQTTPLGPGSYKETYGFLVRVPAGGNACCNIITTPTGQTSSTYTGAGFSRPPSGVLVQGATNTTWVINYHAMFGAVGARRTEVSRVSAVITQFQALVMGNPGQTYPRFIVGGDWNFPDTDQAFTNIRNNLPLANILVQPTALTSLKRGGVGMSSAYDHFLWDSNVVTCNGAAVMPVPGGNLPAFRLTFSDHLGVRIDVQ